MKFSTASLACFAFAGARAVSAELGECAQDSIEADHASMLQTMDVVSVVQNREQSVSQSGARITERHGQDGGTSEAGIVDFDEIRRAKRRSVPRAAAPTLQRKVGDAFDLFDMDGDGQVTPLEIGRVFRLNKLSVGTRAAGAEDENSLLQQTGGDIESDAVAAFFAAFDLDGDGEVSRDEYDLQQNEAVNAQRQLEMDALRGGNEGGELLIE